MKKVHLMMVGSVLLCLTGMAQTDTLFQKNPASDTLRVGSIIIIKNEKENKNEEIRHKGRDTHRSRWRNKVSTNWFVVDLGFANHNDKTNYGTTEARSFVHGTTLTRPADKSDFAVKTGSFNFNVWLFMQRMSLYKQVVNLKYGAGIELYKYYYKSDIRYTEAPMPYVERQNISFKRNKLAFDYVTVPLMLNINPLPGHKNGASARYLYGARNKQKSDDLGKQKFAGDFNLERWKLAYIAELGLGPVRLYGSYAITPLHQYGVDQHPYAVGIRFSSW
jgi:hypothetical protein